jgi:Response regulator containing a CheY-like receiver domain and an HTH DNA-binding domain
MPKRPSKKSDSAGSKNSVAPPPGQKPTRVLLADDHPVIRHGIAACLNNHPNLEVVGEASDGKDTLRKAKELSPDIILMDIDMPHTNGLAVTETLRKELPQIKVLILSMSNSATFVPRILQSGARGYIAKDAPTDELVKAIETVQRGETFFGEDVAQIALKQMMGGNAAGASSRELSPRERDVLIGIAKGLSNKEIASQLNIGTRTVETHRDNLMRKLDIRSVGGLTKYALANGLVMLREEVR